jgi:hypothetical protein
MTNVWRAFSAGHVPFVGAVAPTLGLCSDCPEVYSGAAQCILHVLHMLNLVQSLEY